MSDLERYVHGYGWLWIVVGFAGLHSSRFGFFMMIVFGAVSAAKYLGWLP